MTFKNVEVECLKGQQQVQGISAAIQFTNVVLSVWHSEALGLTFIKVRYKFSCDFCVGVLINPHIKSPFTPV
jgi:hypothetical protein